ncbi:c-type cytochrome [Loktanella sp. DJP18]|uniref:c-type cytochrome n=1 Tax=Loktanella sp. DJP18 TaxID=3409788 RepID=UPI003BB6208F
MRLLPAFLICLALPVAAQDADAGKALFQTHCATCHGVAASGDGPMANMLLVRPPDLTTLTQRYGGTFPIARIVMRIDGRDPLTSHGSPMPVYGDFFEGWDVAVKAETGQPIMTSVPVVDLLAYLAGVQGSGG